MIESDKTPGPVPGEETMTKKRISFSLLFSLCLLIAAPAVRAQSPGPVLDSLMDGYTEESIQVAFGSFTWAYSKLASPFSRWLEDEFTKAMGASDKYRVFNRAIVAAMDPAFREIYADFFATNQVGGLLTGRFFEEGSRIRTRVELTDMRTGNLIGSADWTIAKTAVPRSIRVRPDSLERERIERLSKLVPEEKTDTAKLEVSVSTDRGHGAAYRAGEYLTAFVTVTRDAWVRLYHIDSSGKTQLIWPNTFENSDGRIKAGTAIRIPGPGDPFAFLMGAPWGTEYIKAVASSVPFADGPEAFTDLGTDSGAAIRRGLSLAARPNSEEAVLAEDLASYLISE